MYFSLRPNTDRRGGTSPKWHASSVLVCSPLSTCRREWDQPLRVMCGDDELLSSNSLTTCARCHSHLLVFTQGESHLQLKGFVFSHVDTPLQLAPRLFVECRHRTVARLNYLTTSSTSCQPPPTLSLQHLKLITRTNSQDRNNFSLRPNTDRRGGTSPKCF